MQRLQAFKYELMPNGEQECNMRRFAGARRFVYNQALVLQKTNYESGGKYIGYFCMTKHLVELKKEFPWLKESPSQALQQSLKDAERAYKNFFEKRADFPRFKRKGTGESFRFPQGFDIDQSNSRIKFPKLGWVRYRNSRETFGTAKNITVSNSDGKWCGNEENADVVGAMNVLARGHRVAACGEDGSGLARKRRAKPASAKQEPTEVTMREVTHV